MLLPVLDSGQVYWAMQQPDRLVTDQCTIVHRECGDSVVVIVTSSKRVEVHLATSLPDRRNSPVQLPARVPTGIVGMSAGFFTVSTSFHPIFSKSG